MGAKKAKRRPKFKVGQRVELRWFAEKFPGTVREVKWDRRLNVYFCRIRDGVWYAEGLLREQPAE